MDEHDWLAGRFEDNRAHLRAVAGRMLGSPAEADDAVQEAWLRLSRAGADGVGNLTAWLTTVVGRICLDMLRSRGARREEPLETAPASAREEASPESQVLLADSVGLALLAVLEMLAPAERVAFVLHDMFDLPFDEIAPIVERSPAAARQLASRARRRVHGAGTPREADPGRQREVVSAFLAASRDGDFEALVAMLDPDAVLRADAAAGALAARAAQPVLAGAEPEVRGAVAVAGIFSGRARGARPALINGMAGAVWMHRGEPRVVFGFTLSPAGKITQIGMVADPDQIGGLDLVLVRS